MSSLASWICLYFLYWILILNHSPYSNVFCSALLGLTPPAYKAQDLMQLGLRGCQDHFHVHPGGCSPLPTCISNLILFLIEVQLIYNVVLIAAVQQSDSVIHIYIYTHSFSYSFHYDLSWAIEYSSPCYTVGPCCLTFLYMLFFSH